MNELKLIIFLLFCISMNGEKKKMIIESKGQVFEGFQYRSKINLEYLLKKQDLKKNTILYLLKEMILSKQKNDYKNFKSMFYKLDEKIKSRGMTEKKFKEKYFKNKNEYTNKFLKKSYIRSYIKFKEYLVLLIIFENDEDSSPVPFFFKKNEGKLYMDMLIEKEIMEAIAPYMEYELENPPANIEE